MRITLQDSKTIFFDAESHFSIVVNGKTVVVAIWSSMDRQMKTQEQDREILQGGENLTDNEKEFLAQFIDDYIEELVTIKELGTISVEEG